MAKLVLHKCPCLRPKIEEEVHLLDYRHCSLNDLPSEVFSFERTLEELYADSNQLKDLPRVSFTSMSVLRRAICLTADVYVVYMFRLVITVLMVS